MTQPVFRFAPSPNGYLHLGHALSALLNSEMARAVGGRLPAAHRGHRRGALPAGIRGGDLRGSRLARHRVGGAGAAAVASISTTIAPRWRSSKRRAWSIRASRAAPRSRGLSRERDRRAVAARSRTARRSIPAARKQLAAGRARAPHRGRRALRAAARHGRRRRARRRAHLGRDRRRPDSRITRRLMAAAAGLGRRGARAQGHADELSSLRRRRRRLQGVTHVVRGQDLFWSTSVHRLLQALLGLPAPLYHHHRLILDADGRKLSKSTQATALRELREQGATPADIRRMVGLAELPYRDTIRSTIRHPACADWPLGPPVACCARGWDVACVKSRCEVRRQAAAQDDASRAAPRADAVETALAALAHEIRTPLTGILALGELLAAADLPRARAAAGRASVKGAAEHLAALDDAGRRRRARRGDAGWRCGEKPFRPRALAEAIGATLAARARGQGPRRRDRASRTTCPNCVDRRRGAAARGAGKPRSTMR